MKTGSCGEQRDAGGERVDFVLLVEAHHLLLHALSVVLVFLLDLFDLRLQRLQRAHPFERFVGERDQQRPGADREGDDRRPPAEADVVVEELEDRVGDVDQRLQDVRRSGSRARLAVVVLGRVDRADPQGEAVGDRVEAAVAERVAAQQAPGGEQQRRGSAEAADRLGRVGRAGRLVAAAARQGGRDPALVGGDRRQQERVSRGTLPAAGRRASASSMLACDARRRPRARSGRRSPGGRRGRSRAARGSGRRAPRRPRAASA